MQPPPSHQVRSTSAPASPTLSRVVGYALGLLFLAAAVRFSASMGDLWLDEIYTLLLAGDIRRPMDVFTELTFDNNHCLNTLCIYYLGPGQLEWVYRMPAFLAGVLTILASGIILRQQLKDSENNPPAPETQALIDRGMLLGMFFTSASFLLIQYGSEARGYAPCIAFGLLAWPALQQGNARRRTFWVPVFWCMSMLSVLSHAIGIYFLAGALAWLLVRLLPVRPRHSALLTLLCWQAFPAAGTLVFYLTFLRQMRIIGGDARPLLAVIANTCAFTLGLPAAANADAVTFSSAIAIALVALAWGLGIWMLVRRRRWDLLCMYVAGAWLAPAFLLTFTPRNDFVYERYFLPTVVMTLLLLAQTIAWAWGRQPALRPVWCLLCALFLLGNAWQAYQLTAIGRGHYRQAVIDMLQANPKRPLNVAVDHMVRTRIPLTYYTSALGQHDAINCLTQDPPGQAVPDFFVLQSSTNDAPAQPSLTLDGGPAGPLHYRLAGIYPFAGLSGQSWRIYTLER